MDSLLNPNNKRLYPVPKDKLGTGKGCDYCCRLSIFNHFTEQTMETQCYFKSPNKTSSSSSSSSSTSSSSSSTKVI